MVSDGVFNGAGRVERIAEYCGICDNYREGGSCAIPTILDFDQQRYVDQGLCGWGMISGVRVHVMSDSVTVKGEEFSRGSDELEEALRACEDFKEPVAQAE